MENNKDIHKWMNGELSDKEIENVDELKKITHYLSHLKVPNTDVNIAFEEFNKRKKQKKNKVFSLKFYSKIAAAILLLLAPVYYLYYLNATTTINTLIAETSTFNLPDDSEVSLSAHSNITYQKGKWKNNRSLKLQGEAYFKVQKGKTFTVKTDAGTIQVLGTQFNVKQRNNIFEVVCYEGAVKVTTQKSQKILHPGNIFQIINNKETQHKLTHRKSPNWIHQESSFTNIPLIDVLAELKRYYPVKIDISNINQQKLFNGSFTHKNLDIALKTITIPLNITYSNTNNTIILSNNE